MPTVSIISMFHEFLLILKTTTIISRIEIYSNMYTRYRVCNPSEDFTEDKPMAFKEN